MKEELLQRIETVIGRKSSEPVHLHEPSFNQDDKDYLNSCIDSGFVSSVGEYVNEFEKSIKILTGAEAAVSCTNGTAALHLCLIAANVENGDEVLMPSLTFAATANACIYNNSTPHFIDVSQKTLSVDPVKLRQHLEKKCEFNGYNTINKSTKKTIKALIVMHCFGHIGEFDELKSLCDEYKIQLIEDAAESLGSTFKGKQSGNLAQFAAISFNGNKIITTGGGGMFLTKDVKIAKKIKHLSTTAKQPHPYKFVHDQVGFNYRMPNLNAALGMAQIKKLPIYLEQKRNLAAQYKESFKDFEFATFINEPDNCKSNYWLNSIALSDEQSIDKTILYLHENNIFARPIWTPLHKLEHFKNNPKSCLAVTNKLENKIICLPSSPYLAL